MISYIPLWHRQKDENSLETWEVWWKHHRTNGGGTNGVSTMVISMDLWYSMVCIQSKTWFLTNLKPADLTTGGLVKKSRCEALGNPPVKLPWKLEDQGLEMPFRFNDIVIMFDYADLKQYLLILIL